MNVLARLALLLGLRVAPALPVAVVHRGEVEILPGPDARRTEAPPAGKLSPEAAALLLGIPVRIVGR